MIVRLVCSLLVALMAAGPAGAAGFRDRLQGLVFEVEEFTEPKDAWAENTFRPDKWNLWTAEEDVINKRSGGRSLASPRVEKDRATPEEGAPPLHTRITGIPKGTYHAFMNATNRCIALSFDGKTWEKREPAGEVDLGIATITDGTFEVWVDDRYANTSNIGSSYYDYIRFEKFTPPVLSHFAVFPVADARTRLLERGAPAPGSAGSAQFSWISDQRMPTGVVEFGQKGRFDQRAESTETSLRNHRAVSGPLAAGDYQARVRVPFGRSVWTSPVFRFTVGARGKAIKSRALRVALTVAEPTGAGRRQWPVTSGVPYPQGALGGAADVSLVDAAGRPVPARLLPASYWPDGSIRWLTVSFAADTDPARPVRYTLVSGPSSGRGAGKGAAAPLPAMPAGDLEIDARVLDAGGKAFTTGRAISRGRQDALRRDAFLEGDFTGPEGGKPFQFRREITTFAGQPWARVRFSILNGRVEDVTTLLQGAGLRLPLSGEGALQGSFDGRPLQTVADPDSFELLQDKDDHFTLKAGADAARGEHSLGFATARRAGRQMSVFVKDFWQTYPKGLAIKPDGLHVRLLPVLPEDAYAKESEDAEALIRLYYPYVGGKYRIKRGMEFTTELYVLMEEKAPADPASLRRWADWFQKPLFAAATPETYCASGAFGPVEARAPGRFDAYNQLAERGFERIEQNRLQKHEYGWMNYGDWHGERHFNWGNNEYDLQWGLGLEFARSGDLKYLWRGAQAAWHTSTIDTIHVPWPGRMVGMVYAHSVGHTGGHFDPKDARFRKLGNVFGLANPDAPNPFLSEVVDPGGHTFKGGDFLYAMLLGEPYLLEVAEQSVGYQAAHMTPNFRFGIERAAGWPLTNAVEAYENTGNPFYLNAARLYVEKVVAQQDPQTGDFRLNYGPPECFHTPPHVGGKAFATGVLLYGLMRYHMQTREPAAKECLVRSARWLANTSWNSRTHAFRYISTCPTFDSPRGNGATDLLTAAGMAYSLALQPDAKVREVLLDSLARSLRSTGGDGKGYAGDIHHAPHALALLRGKLGVAELPEPVGESDVRAKSEVRAAPGEEASLRLVVTNGQRGPVPFTARVASLPAGWKAQPEQIEFQAPSGTAPAAAFRFTAGAGTAAGEAVLACTLNGKPAGEVRVRLVPQAPEALAPAADAAGFGVIGKPDSPTVLALTGIPGVQTGVTPDAVTRFRGVALAADYFAGSEQKPQPLLDRLVAFARGGGTVVLFQLNDDAWLPGLLPHDLILSDTNGEVRDVVAREHPLFAGVGGLAKVICWDTVVYAAPEWKVLARDSAGGPAILEAPVGKGKVLIIEPSVDRIVAAADTAPLGVEAADCKRLLENVVRVSLE